MRSERMYYKGCWNLLLLNFWYIGLIFLLLIILVYVYRNLKFICYYIILNFEN